MRSRFFCATALAAVAMLGCSSVSEEAGSDTASASVSSTACLSVLACPAPSAPIVSRRPWRHSFASPIATHAGSPNHRGRDSFVNPGAPQTVIAKFAYGIVDKDLEDEEIDVFVQRDCASGWEALGTAVTLRDGDAHPSVDGVPPNGGRVYFEIPSDRQLGPGRHRVRLVVAGDGTSTDLFIDVVPPKTPIFVTDVDGTLTSSENAEFLHLLTGDLPAAHPSSPEALRALAEKGYRPVYLTARPEWLVGRTREFLDKNGFPPGVLHTSTSLTGAGTGAGASDYKRGELAMLADKGLVPDFGFGNKPTDSQAYASIEPEDHRIFFQISGPFTGRKIDAYAELLPGFATMPAVCRP